MKREGSPFQNSPVCTGVGFADQNAPIDIAKIELTGRYPETGWVMNKTTYELAYVIEGTGEFMRREGEVIPLNVNDVISITAGTAYAWNGNLTLIVACNPPFDPSQHNLLEEN